MKRSSGIDGRILYVLAQAERAMHNRLDRDLEPSGISLVGYSVLRLVAEDVGITASEIARRTLISQQAGSRLTARLVRSGLLTTGGAAGRRVPLSLSPKGLKALASAHLVVSQWEQRAQEALGVAVGDLDRQLRKIEALFAQP